MAKPLGGIASLPDPRIAPPAAVAGGLPLPHLTLLLLPPLLLLLPLLPLLLLLPCR
jgi:hypothetical protein